MTCDMIWRQRSKKQIFCPTFRKVELGCKEEQTKNDSNSYLETIRNHETDSGLLISLESVQHYYQLTDSQYLRRTEFSGKLLSIHLFSGSWSSFTRNPDSFQPRIYVYIPEQLKCVFIKAANNPGGAQAVIPGSIYKMYSKDVNFERTVIQL